jgi:transmembrane 9 superfamily protein 2/4
MLLSSIVGTGFQLFSMVFIVLLLGTFGFLNPEKRTKIFSVFIFIYIIMGMGGGFVSAEIYKIMGGKDWLKMSLLTSVLFPGILFLVYLLVNILLVFEKSGSAVSLYDLSSLFFLWIFCTLPLILIGTFLGIKSKRIKLPCKVNKIPRKIPDKPWYLHYRYLSSVTGLLCFLTILFELNYIMRAIWKHELYFVIPFLWISYCFFVTVSAEISIIVVFWNLCYGDYNWWWKSFLVGSSPVIYFILYSIYYFIFKMSITRFSAIVVYFGIMGLISTMALFISASVSVLICLGFNLRIYSEIKID